MDFQPTEDQQHLRAGVRGLLAGRYGREALRASVDASAEAGAGVDRALWRELGEAGFFALRLPEAEGGVGLGLPEAVLVFEEAGRALVPGPLVATHLAAGVVPGAAAGTAVVTAFDLDGPLVAHLGDADAVLGAAAVPAGEPVRSVDPLTPLHRVAAVGDVSAYRDAGALLTAALQLGSALRTVELAVRYAGEREQFGQPIGAFQAVKHLCARMLVRAEVARTAVYAAAVTGDPGEVAAAKLLADEAAVLGARDCLQVHGGMGFTWEADVHLHLKRAWVRAEQWRTAAQAEELLAGELLGSAGSAGSAG
ncbi:acyl-CoA dehydrogenase family protein [Streptomyces avidinii]|uniref:Alkylation response protein AidB-like acyl-CoA dehydrogenase n=1 Tax=Streptomyces avidinii TaxID=1895 RepID=A0ABS4L8G2_STRAV|nr:acyl-CoA dehydrogenase [Streptomyces avidinii]MBP2038404.1 alkylation response protein AidB-like acyl-CoA dehydrogenase [Streptomyces avidinii]GGZ15075.1 acyl-CoA dehydrogenase [Streptomyces avidinii]